MERRGERENVLEKAEGGRVALPLIGAFTGADHRAVVDGEKYLRNSIHPRDVAGTISDRPGAIVLQTRVCAQGATFLRLALDAALPVKKQPRRIHSMGAIATRGGRGPGARGSLFRPGTGGLVRRGI